jgi:ribosome-binding ATPase YchF (GTP1/OBG family)
MKIGIVGYQGSGKSSLFEWLTGVAADPALAHATQHAMATVPESRVAPLCEIYKPKKVTMAALELVDTPGLSRTHEGSAAKLAKIREASCLVVVVSAFDGADPLSDLRNFEDDLLIADLDIVAGRIERIHQSLKKPHPGPEREQLQHELKELEPLRATLDAGTSLRNVEMTAEQLAATRSFMLLSQKPRLAVLNLAEDETKPERFLGALPADLRAVAVSLSLQLGLAKMADDERAEFCGEMGVEIYDRGELIRKIMDASGQMLFFTAGDKEVRTWMIHQGGTAVEAAGNIHTDLARGFIRAETMNCVDLIRLGSERELKAHNLMRHEPKDYVIRDGDIINIRFSV